MTMASRNSSAVPIKGLTDNRNITLAFVGRLLTNASYISRENNSQPATGLQVPQGICYFTESEALVQRK
jgi:hypothetical protein